PEASETSDAGLESSAEKGALARPAAGPDGSALLTPGTSPTQSVSHGAATACQRDAGSCSRRTTPRGSPSRRDEEKGYVSDPEKRPLVPRGRPTLTPDQYTDWAVHQGQRIDIRDYPSLDKD